MDWNLIACHLPDMLQVAQSIRAGRISPSTILRKLEPPAARTSSTMLSASWAGSMRAAFVPRLHQQQGERTAIMQTGFGGRCKELDRVAAMGLFAGADAIYQGDIVATIS